MGRRGLVVDGQLKVYGIENLRIADGSIMPRVTTGNTMAPCMIIGERAAAFSTLSPRPRVSNPELTIFKAGSG